MTATLAPLFVALAVAADAGAAPVGPQPPSGMRPGAVFSPPPPPPPPLIHAAGAAPPAGSWQGQGRPPWHFRRHHGFGFTYATMAPPDVVPADDDEDARGSDKDHVRVVMVPVPYPVTPPPPPAPRPPPPIVRYAITGEPIDIPKGAKVTRGSVYRYRKGGVNVYTDAPPPAAAHGTLLFDYTEAVAPAAKR